MSAATQTTDPRPTLAGTITLPRARKHRSVARAILRQVLQGVALTVLAAASYLVISQFFLRSVKVVGRSMVPTLSDSQQYLLNRWVYHFRAPHHSDIVVLRDPSDNGFSVKRIIAAPGDSIYLKDGGVYLNGRKLNEDYLVPGTRTFTESKYRDQLILCGRDQYFLLGDNRGNSIDSRTYGPVPRGNILGMVIR
jgi:signal peptidase I